MTRFVRAPARPTRSSVLTGALRRRWREESIADAFGFRSSEMPELRRPHHAPDARQAAQSRPRRRIRVACLPLRGVCERQPVRLRGVAEATNGSPRISVARSPVGWSFLKGHCTQKGSDLKRLDCARRGARQCASKVDATLRTRNLVSSFTFRTSLSILTTPSSSSRTNRSWSTTAASGFRPWLCDTRTKIDDEIAHDPLDDVGAKPVVLGNRITLHRGQTTFRVSADGAPRWLARPLLHTQRP